MKSLSDEQKTLAMLRFFERVLYLIDCCHGKTEIILGSMGSTAIGNFICDDIQKFG